MILSPTFKRRSVGSNCLLKTNTDIQFIRAKLRNNSGTNYTIRLISSKSIPKTCMLPLHHWPAKCCKFIFKFACFAAARSRIDRKDVACEAHSHQFCVRLGQVRLFLFETSMPPPGVNRLRTPNEKCLMQCPTTGNNKHKLDLLSLVWLVWLLSFNKPIYYSTIRIIRLLIS